MSPESRGRADPRAHLAMVLVHLGFGAWPVMGKAVLVHMQPLALATLRVAAGAPLLLGLAWIVERRLPARRDLPALAALGLLGVFLNQLLFVVGLSYTTATNASILTPLIPVFAVALGFVFGVERPRRGTILGVALSVAGALVMLDVTRFSVSDGRVVGNGIIMVNCLAYAGFLVLHRPVLRRLPPLTLLAWAYVFGGLAMGAVGWSRLAAVDAAALPGSVWACLAYIVLVPTVVCYALNSWAISRSSPALAAAYSTVQPVVGALLAAIFLGEAAGPREALGFLLIAGGLLAVGRATVRSRP